MSVHKYKTHSFEIEIVWKEQLWANSTVSIFVLGLCDAGNVYRSRPTEKMLP